MVQKFGLIFGFYIIVLVSHVRGNFYETIGNELQFKIASNPTISDNCKSAYEDRNLAIQFIDASAKVPNGIFGGYFYDLGNFDLCYNIDNHNQSNRIYGKYCLITVPLAELIHPSSASSAPPISTSINRIAITPRMLPIKNGTLTGFHLGQCFPNTCTSADVQEIFELIGIGKFTKVVDDYCYSKESEPELTGGAIGTITFFGIMLALVVISTIYDSWLHYNDQKPSQELFIAFSVLTNGQKLFKSSTNPDQLLCLNGLRAISMMWVILGHIYSNQMMGAIFNILTVSEMTTKKEYMWLTNAPLSVDTFFTIGGLVTMYTFMRSVDKGVTFNIPLYYLHRYLRLTPVLGAVILVHANLLQYFGNGPLWGDFKYTLVENCQKSWWGALLYIQNFLDADACVPQTWYLSADMQIFVFSPLLLYPVMKWPKLANALFAVFIGFGILIPALVTHFEGLSALMTTQTDPAKNLKKYYIQAYTRFGPYVIGMLFGYYIYKMKKNKTIFKPTDYKLLTICGWIVSLGILVACLYGNANDLDTTEDHQTSSILFNAFARNSWGVGVCLVTVLCVFGLGGIINTFLSLPIFQLLTKVSYSMYLIHYPVIILRLASSRLPVYFSNFSIMHSFWGDFMLTLAISICFCLIFESPVIILEKYLLCKGKKSNKSPEKTKA